MPIKRLGPIRLRLALSRSPDIPGGAGITTRLLRLTFQCIRCQILRRRLESALIDSLLGFVDNAGLDHDGGLSTITKSDAVGHGGPFATNS